jgi:hypothetical protein
VVGVGALGGLALVGWAPFQGVADVDLLDDEDFVLDVDLALGL